MASTDHHTDDGQERVRGSYFLAAVTVKNDLSFGVVARHRGRDEDGLARAAL